MPEYFVCVVGRGRVLLVIRRLCCLRRSSSDDLTSHSRRTATPLLNTSVRFNEMFSNNSPFLNIPVALDSKQAVFIDGLRHAAQIAGFAYDRLCSGLTDVAVNYGKHQDSKEFIPLFLDAWSFVDATDRFRFLWEMQPNAATLPEKFSPAVVRAKLQSVNDVRNVADHIAQKIDQIVSLNSSVLGSISWLTVASHSPLTVKTCFIRPGIIRGQFSDQLAVPNSPVDFRNDSGCISVSAGKHKCLLSDAFATVCEIVSYAEDHLNAMFQSPEFSERCPSDMLGIADLNTERS